MELTSVFVTGLFAGGLTCLAVQGGLLASSLAQQEENKLKEKAKLHDQIFPILSFLIARLISYTFLGLLLGSLGSVVQLSLSARVVLQFVVAVFMLGTALNLLEIDPIFRYFVIQPPKFLTRLIRNQSKSKSIFGPALLGAFTILIPCGATQAMMAYAISTGSAILGALTMFTFILGTSPLFFLLGFVTKKLGTSMRNFNKLASFAIILIALYNINGALALSGSNFTIKNIFSKSPNLETSNAQAVNQATIYITKSGYTFDSGSINFKANTKVKLKLVNKDAIGCIQAFTIPKLKLQKVVPMGASEEIVFTTPSTKGPLPFMCSMGMYRGIINII